MAQGSQPEVFLFQHKSSHSSVLFSVYKIGNNNNFLSGFVKRAVVAAHRLLCLSALLVGNSSRRGVCAAAAAE